MLGRCGCDGAATSLRRRADVGPMSLRWRCDGAATSSRCRADDAATSLRRRADVGPMSLRWRYDVAPTSGRCRADVGPMSLRWRSDVQYAHAHKHVYGPRLARKEAGPVQGGLSIDQTECLCQRLYVPPACRIL